LYLEEIEHTRVKVSKLTDAKYKSKLDQFHTNYAVADAPKARAAEISPKA
jgi:hypothetical protein